jgi:hypothetical protein
MIKMNILLAILALILFGGQNCLGACYALPSPEKNEVRIFAQDVCGGVDNNPQNPTTFTIDQPQTVTKVGTYHWNHGQGTQSPGTIGLQDSSGKTYGPWQASGQPGMGGVTNAYWIATIPNGVDLPAGKYTVIDSDPSTWATNSESSNSGVVSVVGLAAGNHDTGNTKGPQAPCAGTGGSDFSLASPTDQFRAGPSLVPGSYKIWYGKRTGPQI